MEKLGTSGPSRNLNPEFEILNELSGLSGLRLENFATSEKFLRKGHGLWLAGAWSLREVAQQGSCDH